jgi:hypothetical protein
MSPVNTIDTRIKPDQVQRGDPEKGPDHVDFAMRKMNDVETGIDE